MKKEITASLKLAYPIILGELAQVALHLIDSAMVGQVSYYHLGASALANNIIHIPFIMGMGLTIAIAQMTSLYQGRHDHKNVSHYFFNGMFIILLASLIIATSLLFGKDLVYNMKQDIKVATLAEPYFKIIAWSLIPALLFFGLKQFTDGLQYTKTAMALSLFALPLNVFLNWLLIYGNWGFPRLELIGAGIGTLLTRVIIFVLLLILVLYHPLYKKYKLIAPRAWKLSKKTMRDILSIGIPSSFQLTMEAGAFAISGLIIGSISAISLASHQIALSISSFTFMASVGLSQALSIRTSNAYSQNNWVKVGIIGKSGLYLTALYGIFCALIFLFFRFPLSSMFTQNEEVLQLAGYLLILSAIFQVPDTIQVNSSGLLRGIKDVKVPSFIVAMAYWVIGIPLGVLLAFKFNMGAQGIWIGLIIGLTISSIFLTRRFFNTINRNKM